VINPATVTLPGRLGVIVQALDLSVRRALPSLPQPKARQHGGDEGSYR
jgi:hypothetical protein